SFQGCTDSGKLGQITYQDRHGLIGGDGVDIKKDKPKGLIRIILTGGSGMRGTMESGTYDYPTSIAGNLKRILSIRYPDKKFEVINAAVVRHLFVQSYAGYYEKLHDFHPDI